MGREFPNNSSDIYIYILIEIAGDIQLVVVFNQTVVSSDIFATLIEATASFFFFVKQTVAGVTPRFEIPRGSSKTKTPRRNDEARVFEKLPLPMSNFYFVPQHGHIKNTYILTWIAPGIV